MTLEFDCGIGSYHFQECDFFLMRILRQLTVNDECLEPFPFARELSMQSYLLDNPEILNLDDEYCEVQIFNDEVRVLGEEFEVSNGKDGRIDIVASYSGQHIALFELKKDIVSEETLTQLGNYLSVRNQLPTTSILSKDETNNPSWVGILVGADITDDLRAKILAGHSYTDQIGNKIPIAAITL